MEARSLSVVGYAEAVACIAAIQRLCDSFADAEHDPAARRATWTDIENEHAVLAALLQEKSPA
jgi:hypothetical protein